MITFWISIGILVIGLALKNNGIQSLAYFLIFLCVIVSLADSGLGEPQDVNDSESIYDNIESFYKNNSLLTPGKLSIRFHECNYTGFKITLDEIECKDEEIPESNNSIFIIIACDQSPILDIKYCYGGRESPMIALYGEDLIMDLKDKLNEKVKT